MSGGGPPGATKVSACNTAAAPARSISGGSIPAWRASMSRMAAAS
jgi:hypothetical protein